jgi:Holliday junction resolvase RusA-like endonuclease
MLPQPPSVHELWQRDRRSRKLHRSPKYQAWLHEADGVAMQQQAFRGRVPFADNYAARITLSSGSWLDIDNGVKPLLDWAVSRGLTRDDRFCRELHVSYSHQVQVGWVLFELKPLLARANTRVAEGSGIGLLPIG